jgi:hypothetical protein
MHYNKFFLLFLLLFLALHDAEENEKKHQVLDNARTRNDKSWAAVVGWLKHCSMVASWAEGRYGWGEAEDISP